MKTIEDLSLASKKVLIRCDLDVPMDANNVIADDHRVRAALPTIEFAKEKGAKVIIMGHMGRPKGKVVPELSLKPVADRIGEHLKTDVKFVDQTVGEKVSAAISELKDGEVCVIENVRFNSGEEKNDAEFSKALASLCEVYVNNAFATAHRAHASTAGIASFVNEKAAGFTLRDEVEYFNRSCKSPNKPLVAIFGGAKVSSKIKAIKNVGAIADTVIVGGAMANTFFLAEGKEVGSSLVEKDLVNVATETQEWFKANNKKLLLPVDVVVAKEFAAGAPSRTVSSDEIPQDEMALDIGPKSVELFGSAIQDAKTIVWNGPMGAFETEGFSQGTFDLIDHLTQCAALTVAGGGDTDLALHMKGAFESIDFVSTAGGAFLALLEGETLPALAALEA